MATSPRHAHASRRSSAAVRRRRLVALVVLAAALVPCQQPQGLFGDARMIGEHLEGGDQTVAAEQRDEPGHASGKIGIFIEVGAQDAEAAERAVHELIQRRAITGYLRDLGEPLFGLRLQV